MIATEHLTEREVAALRTRSVPAAEAFPLLEHAASCKQCGMRVISAGEMAWEMAALKQTLAGRVSHLTLEELNDLVDETLPIEGISRVNAHLQQCEACSRDVRELRREAGKTRPAVPASARDAPGWLGSLLGAPWIVFATVVLVIAAGGTGALLRRGGEGRRNVPGTPVAATQGTSEAAPEVISNGPASLPKEPTTTAAPPRTTPALAFVLTPGLVRHGGQTRVLHVPADSVTVRLALTSRTTLPSGRYSVSLSERERVPVWSKEVMSTSAATSLVIRVPGGVLRPGRYVLTLSALEEGRREALEDYAFRVEP